MSRIWNVNSVSRDLMGDLTAKAPARTRSTFSHPALQTEEKRDFSKKVGHINPRLNEIAKRYN